MTDRSPTDRYVRLSELRRVVRDWMGRRLRNVGLHWLSGWWDAGTDQRTQ